MDTVFDKIARCDNCEYDVDGKHIMTDMIAVEQKLFRQKLKII